MTEDDVLGSEIKISSYIRNNPGCYLRQIKKEVKLSMGTIQYHIDRLENKGAITSIRSGLYKHYFSTGKFKDNEKDIIKFLSQGIVREIIMLVLEKGNPTQTEIAKSIRISPPSTNWHLKRLIEANLLDEQKDGRFKRYTIKKESDSQYILEFIKNYYPTIWDNWSDRLVKIFLSLSTNKEWREDI